MIRWRRQPETLEGTLQRLLREDVGELQTVSTELAKQMPATGNETALEKENIRLRVRLHEMEERVAKLEAKVQQNPAGKATPKGAKNSSTAKQLTGQKD